MLEKPLQFTDRNGRRWEVVETSQASIGWGHAPAKPTHAVIHFQSDGEDRSTAVPIDWRDHLEELENWFEGSTVNPR